MVGGEWVSGFPPSCEVAFPSSLGLFHISGASVLRGRGSGQERGTKDDGGRKVQCVAWGVGSGGLEARHQAHWESAVTPLEGNCWGALSPSFNM